MEAEPTISLCILNLHFYGKQSVARNYRLWFSVEMQLIVGSNRYIAGYISSKIYWYRQKNHK